MTALKAQKQLQLFLYSQKIYQTAKVFRKMDQLKILQWNCRLSEEKHCYQANRTSRRNQ